MSETVTIYEKKERIAKITLNRPEKLNAVIPAMIDEVTDHIRDAAKDDTVRVLIITGAGRGFCAGDDLEHLKKLFADGDAQPSLPAPAGPLATALRMLDKPTISMVNGAAVGIGCDLAIMCDFVIASENARFGEVYIQRGVVPGAGNWLLPRMVGLKKAAELLLLGDMFDAREAERLGLVHKVVAAGELEAVTMELANRLASMAPVAMRFTKHALMHALEWNLETTLEYISYARSVAAKTREASEGVASFHEKRPPRF